jgi:hypothetical protein
MQEWFNLVCKSINIIQNINRIKDKNHTNISVDTEKVFDKIQYPFTIKALKKKVGIKGMCTSIIKAIYNKLVDNIILNGEKLKPFPLKSRMRQECLSSLIQYSAEFLARAVG